MGIQLEYGESRHQEEVIVQERIPDLVVAVHGIRTFGDWQYRLLRLLDEWPIERFTVMNYGFLSALLYWIPWVRHAKARQFQDRMDAALERRAQRLGLEVRELHVDIVAHSFGTYLVTTWLAELARRQSESEPMRSNIPQVNIVIFSGSVVRSNFDWHPIVGDDLPACCLINECGTRDVPLLMNMFLGPLGRELGVGGRVGFSNGSLAVRNYFHPLGHSGFFKLPSDGGSKTEFMKQRWVPLIKREKRPVDGEQPSGKNIGAFNMQVLTRFENALFVVTVLIFLVMIVGPAYYYRSHEPALNRRSDLLDAYREMLVHSTRIREQRSSIMNISDGYYEHMERLLTQEEPTARGNSVVFASLSPRWSQERKNDAEAVVNTLKGILPETQRLKTVEKAIRVLLWGENKDESKQSAASIPQRLRDRNPVVAHTEALLTMVLLEGQMAGKPDDEGKPSRREAEAYIAQRFLDALNGYADQDDLGEAHFAICLADLGQYLLSLKLGDGNVRPHDHLWSNGDDQKDLLHFLDIQRAWKDVDVSSIAVAAFEQALSRISESADGRDPIARLYEADLHTLLASHYRKSKRWDDAEKALEDALMIAGHQPLDHPQLRRRLRDREIRARMLGYLHERYAWTLMDRSRYSMAKQHFRDARRYRTESQESIAIELMQYGRSLSQRVPLKHIAHGQAMINFGYAIDQKAHEDFKASLEELTRMVQSEIRDELLENDFYTAKHRRALRDRLLNSAERVADFKLFRDQNAADDFNRALGYLEQIENLSAKGLFGTELSAEQFATIEARLRAKLCLAYLSLYIRSDLPKEERLDFLNEAKGAHTTMASSSPITDSSYRLYRKLTDECFTLVSEENKDPVALKDTVQAFLDKGPDRPKRDDLEFARLVCQIACGSCTEGGDARTSFDELLNKIEDEMRSAMR